MSVLLLWQKEGREGRVCVKDRLSSVPFNVSHLKKEEEEEENKNKNDPSFSFILFFSSSVEKLGPQISKDHVVVLYVGEACQ